jgi:uncharacterized membrane protein
MSVHTSIVAATSCDIFWATRYDVETMPRVTGHVKSVEVLQAASDEGKQSGLKWRESRIYAGKTVEVINTLLRVDSNCPDGAQYCAHYSVCFDQRSWDKAQANQTGSLSVYPIHETACRVVFTVNFVAEGCLAALFFNLMGWYVRRYAVAYITEELEEIAAAAVARQIRNNTSSLTNAVSKPSAVAVSDL